MRDTIDMAREAGADIGTSGRWLMTQAELYRFAAIVRTDEREQGQKWFDAVTAQHKQLILAEREACAKVCDRKAEVMAITGKSCDPDDLATEIRARGNT
jgi:hypothetical protein